MAVDISGGEGSLFWKAGIDTTDLDAGLEKITGAIQLSLKKQVELQTQAAGTQKQLAQSILQSAGALEGLDQGFGRQVKNLSGFGDQVGRVSGAISSAVKDIESHIQTLKGESIELKAGGLDVQPLLQSMETLEKELEKLRAGKIEIKAGEVDISGLTGALHEVQAEYDKLSQQKIKLQVDAEGLQQLPPVFSQVSVDAFKQVKPVIADALQAYRELQKETAEGITVTVNETDTERAFDGLRQRIQVLQNTVVTLKVGGADIAPLESSLAEIKRLVDGLESLRVQPDVEFDTTSFLEQYDLIRTKLSTMEAESIRLKTEGIDTKELDRDIERVKELVDAASESLKLKIGTDDTSINKAFSDLQKKVDALQGEAINLKVGGVDTASLSAALGRVQEKIDAINGFELNGTASLQDEAFQRTYKELQQEIASLEQQTIQLKTAGLDTSAVEADIQRLREALVLPPVDIPIKTGSLREKTAELDALKNKFAELSEVDRNSDIGKGLVANIQQVEGEIERINSAFLKVEQNAAGSLNGKIAAVQKLKAEYAALSEVERNSSAGKNLAQNIHNLDRDVQNINSEFEKTTSLAEKAAVAIGAYMSINAATNFIQDIVRVRGEFQQLEVAFTTMLQSKEKADKLMAEVSQFAATTPFELSDVAEATKQLLAFGIEADNIKDTLRSLGDISAGIGAPIGEIAYLFGTIKTQGVAMTQDVRQFAQRGIPIYEELSKVLKVSVEQVGDLITAGKVGFPEIEKAFQNMTAEGSKFGGLMEAQSKTLTGQLSNLSDAWSRMLNDIGKSNEGVFSGAIGAATGLVTNYQKVLDILKVLTITYGSYKAAVIATTAVQAIQTSMTQGYTIAETLRYRAMLLSEGAMKLLNRTMLANPYVAVATGIAAVVSAFLIFNKTATEVKSKADLLAEAQANVGNRLAETEAKIRPYVEQLKSANLSEQERVNIYEKLRAIDPQIVAGLDAKKVSQQQLTQSVNEYIGALRKKIALETNEQAATSSIRQEQDIQRQIDGAKKLQKTLEDANKNAYSSAVALRIDATKQRIVELNKQLQEQQTITKQLGEENDKLNTPPPASDAAKPRTLKAIDEEIAAQKKLQSESSTTAAEYQKFTEKIKALEEERRKIVGDSKSEIKRQQTEENKLNDLLQQRLDLLKLIQGLQDDASKVGQSEDLSALDKINKKYDEVLQKVEEFNRKAAKVGAQKIGAVEIEKISTARNAELGAEVQRQGAEDYKKTIEEQKRIFDQFESYKQQVGAEKAAQVFAEQTRGFKSYIDQLVAELNRLENDNSQGGKLKKQFLNTQLTEAVKDQNQRTFTEQTKSFQELLQATTTFYEKRKAIEDRYAGLRKTLDKNAGALTSDQFENSLQALEKAKEKELDILEDAATQASGMYDRIGKSTIRFTMQQLNEEIALLKKYLQDNKDKLSPDLVIRISAKIEDLENIKSKVTEVAGHFSEFEKSGTKISEAFQNLANNVGGFNEELGRSLQLVSNLVSGLVTAAKAYDKYKDVQADKNSSGLEKAVAGAGLVGAAVSVVGSIVSAISGIFSKAKQSRIDTENQIKAFNENILKGELQITEQYRERQREQVRLNKLKADGLRDEKKLLEEQKKAVQQQYNDILNQLAQQTAVIAQQPEKYGGFLGIGVKRRVKDITESLAGKSFDELEALFTKGQLVGKAKELFEMLQKLRQEGADIDKMLEDNKRQAAELFTGTTADGIVDSIADGFKNGLRSAQDFADNFQQLMQNAVLQSLKLRVLEGPLKELFDQFSEATQSGDQLTATEISDLQSKYNRIIENAGKQFDQLKQIAGVSFSTPSSQGNTMQGAIKGMTEQQAELLAGQFGGLRLTAMDILQKSAQQLMVMQQIELNTAQALVELTGHSRYWKDVTTGAKKIHVV